MRLGGGGGAGAGVGAVGYNHPGRGSMDESHHDDDDDGLGFLERPCFIVGSLVCLLLACGFATVSVEAVPPLFYAIKYNQFTKTADTSAVYESGRYFIGPFNTFLYFPANVKTIEFSNEPKIRMGDATRYESLHTRTKEGLGLYLQVSLQYRLKKETVGQLYSEFNQNYDQVFISSVRDMLIKSASEYEAADLWRHRKAFGDKMQQLVDQQLRTTYAECWGLQLWVIDLPDNFEASIVKTQVQKQMMLLREQEQVSTNIRAETSVIKAEYDRKVKVMMAGATANFTVTTKSAKAYAQQNVIEAESAVLASLRDVLGLSSAGLVRYQKYDAIDDLEDANILYGFSGSQVLFNGDADSR